MVPFFLTFLHTGHYHLRLVVKGPHNACLVFQGVTAVDEEVLVRVCQFSIHPDGEGSVLFQADQSVEEWDGSILSKLQN